MSPDRFIDVLLVEDSPGDARLTRETLRDAAGEGFRITCVDRLATALGHLAANGTDVALLDLSLPDAHGLDGVRRLQQAHPDLPIVVLTGLSDPDISLSAIRAGAQDYLVKGQGDPELMARAIHYAIDRKRNQTEIIEARDRAEIANRAKSDFLATMSHELRTPLNAIIGFSEMIFREVLGPVGNPEYRNYAKLVHESGAHLLEIINDILDLSKIEAGKIELSETDVDIGVVVVACVRLVEERARNNVVDLRVSLPDAMPPVRADARLLRQILLNLLSNAVKFTPKGGRVSVSAAFEEGRLVLSVVDTGIGMSTSDIERAKLPFTQIDSVLSRKFPGTGLGLPIANSLTEMHGGRLEIESAPGKGTTVRICLPVERTADAKRPHAAKRPTLSGAA
jgi:signal transduction histidine kinase